MPLDAATMSALKERALWDDPLAHMLAHGWPLTKASYLAVATMAEAPDFPLDPELRSTIPHDSVGVGTTTECLRMGFSDRLIGKRSLPGLSGIIFFIGMIALLGLVVYSKANRQDEGTGR